MTKFQLSLIFLVIFGIINSCTPKDNGFKTQDFTGEWRLKALLFDHDSNGFDSAKDIQSLPGKNQKFLMFLNKNGSVLHNNDGQDQVSGKWNLTMKVNAADKQSFLLFPDMTNLPKTFDIEKKTKSELIIFYMDEYLLGGIYYYNRKGYWYVK